jgi:pre-mRNA-splicing factor 38B
MAEEEYSEDQESGDELPINKKNNTLPLWGNKETMNINSLILKNIKSSPYFKQDLYRLKTYHEVVDEIFYKVHRSVSSEVLSF